MLGRWYEQKTRFHRTKIGKLITWKMRPGSNLFFAFLKELAKLLEHQHGYIDLHNIPENKYYSMTQTSDEDEKL